MRDDDVPKSIITWLVMFSASVYRDSSAKILDCEGFLSWNEIENNIFILMATFESSSTSGKIVHA